MSNWNRSTINDSQGYATRLYSQLYSPDSAYDSARQSSVGDDCANELPMTGFFDHGASDGYTSANLLVGEPLVSSHTMGSLASGWTESSDALFDAQQAELNRSMSLDYGELRLAVSEPYSPGISPTTSSSLPPPSFSETGYGETLTSYGFKSELPLNAAEYEGRAEEFEEEEQEEEAAAATAAAVADAEAEAEAACPAPAPTKRKRGRPRLNRPSGSTNSSAATTTATAATKHSSRIPHTEVERKYRNALNAEMERLRANIPTLPQPPAPAQRGGGFGGDGGAPSATSSSALPCPPKPSKAVVLAAAVDYIKQLEAETEKLAGENEELKRGEIYHARKGRRRF